MHHKPLPFQSLLLPFSIAATSITAISLFPTRCSKTRPRCSRCARSSQDCVYPDAPPSLSDLARQVVVLHDTLRTLETRFVSMAHRGTNSADPSSSTSSSAPVTFPLADLKSEFTIIDPSVTTTAAATATAPDLTTPNVCANCTQAGQAAGSCDGAIPCNRCAELGANCFYHPQARSQELALAVGRLNDALDQLNKRTLEFQSKDNVPGTRTTRKESAGSEVSVKEEPFEGGEDDDEEGGEEDEGGDQIDAVMPLPQDAKWTLSYTGGGLRIDANVHRLAQLNALLDDFEQLYILDPGEGKREGEDNEEDDEKSAASSSHASEKKRMRLDPDPHPDPNSANNNGADSNGDGEEDTQLNPVPLPPDRRIFGAVPMLDLQRIVIPPAIDFAPQTEALPLHLIDYTLNVYFTRPCCFYMNLREPVARADRVGWLNTHWWVPPDTSLLASSPLAPPILSREPQPPQQSPVSLFLVHALVSYAVRVALIAHHTAQQPPLDGPSLMAIETVELSLYNRTRMLLQDACFEDPTEPALALPLVQALLLHAWHCFDTRRTTEFWHVGGLAIRLARAAHIETLLRDANSATVDQAQRTWNALVYIDFQAAFLLGRPLAMSDARFVVPPIRNLPLNAKREATLTTCLVPLLSMVRDGIVRGVYAARAGRTVPYGTVLEMDSWLDEWWAQLPNEWRWKEEEDGRKQSAAGGERSDDANEIAFMILLNQHYYLAKILLHQQFLGLSSATSSTSRDATSSLSVGQDPSEDYDEAFEDDDPLLDAAITSLQACLQSALGITSLLELAVLGREPRNGPAGSSHWTSLACMPTITGLTTAVYLSSSVYVRVARTEEDEFGEMAKDGWMRNVKVLGQAVESSRIGGGVLEELVAVLLGNGVAGL